jgi:hypothetical protein
LGGSPERTASETTVLSEGSEKGTKGSSEETKEVKSPSEGLEKGSSGGKKEDEKGSEGSSLERSEGSEKGTKGLPQEVAEIKEFMKTLLEVVKQSAKEGAREYKETRAITSIKLLLFNLT